MNRKEETQKSKFLSLVLRHQPETIGLSLDTSGWANVQELLNKTNAHGIALTLEDLKNIVENNDKKRFALSPDHSLIRASQGHSIQIELSLKEQVPPQTLLHGTADRNLESIKQKGLLKGERHHVHLTDNRETAVKVGMRYGTPVVLVIASAQMHDAGIKFYLSENGVWLTEHVASAFIHFPDELK